MEMFASIGPELHPIEVEEMDTVREVVGKVAFACGLQEGQFGLSLEGVAMYTGREEELSVPASRFSMTTSDVVEVSLLQGTVFGVSVYSAATGMGHNDRCAVRVALANERGELLLDQIIKPEPGMVDPLTELTGVTAEQLADPALPTRAQVVDVIMSLLPPPDRCTLVGYKTPLMLKELGFPPDFYSVVDHAVKFSGYSVKHSGVFTASLEHICLTMLHRPPPKRDAGSDANLAVELYKLVQDPAFSMRIPRRRLERSCFTRTGCEHSWRLRGVCIAGFHPEHCTCGQFSLTDMTIDSWCVNDGLFDDLFEIGDEYMCWHDSDGSDAHDYY
eukprot:TRINITY_DN1212_c1_g1_i17.p1 TRINITY_DN1212_c1_g1~~TRINITY_DN1212_c1_g1_i17.p1  ORF type:complete len:356 (+),score=75.87 TRINITY_DN1212_c1_g1_i17:76-1068(+)